MYGVMDRIQVGGLRSLGQVKLTCGGAVLSGYAHLQVLLGAVGNDLAQKLRELGSVLSLFVSGLLPVQADLRITLSVGDSGHGQIHTYLRALTVEVCP